MRAIVTAAVLTFIVFTSGAQTTNAVRHEGIDQLAWLSGAWCEDRPDGTRVEEYWTAPRAGSMLGAGRTIRGDRTVFFEHLRIEQTKDGIVYFASPRGREATPFTMTEMSDTRVVFENLAHDFPQRIVYERAAGSEDAITARIEGERGDKTESESWTYRRMNGK